MRRPTSALASAVLGTALAASTVTAQISPPASSAATASAATPVSGGDGTATVPASVTASPAGAPINPARGARTLLRNGWDYITYQEYDRALQFFREAERRQNELNDAERTKLNQGIERAQRGLRETAMGVKNDKTYAMSVGIKRPGALAVTRPAAGSLTTAVATTKAAATATASQAQAYEREPIQLAGGGGANLNLQPTIDPAGAPAPVEPRVPVTPPQNLPPLAVQSPAAPQEPVAIPAPIPIPAQVVASASTPAAMPAPPDLAEVEGVPLPKLEPGPEPSAPATAPSPSPATTPAAIPGTADEALRPATAPLTPPAGSPSEGLPELPPPPEDVPLPVPSHHLPAPAPSSTEPIPVEPPSAPSGTLPSPAVPTPAPVESPSPLERTPVPTPAQMPAPVPMPSVDEEPLVPLPANLGERPEAPVAAPSPTPSPSEIPSASPSPVPSPVPGPESTPAPVETPAPPQQPLAGLPGSTPGETAPMPTGASVPTDAPPAPAAEEVPVPSAAPTPELLTNGGGRASTLTPELQAEVAKMARRQEDEFRQRPVPAPVPVAPGDVNISLSPSGSTSSKLEISRAPSPTEARPIKGIPVPEEFVPLPKREWEPNRKYWAAAATCHLPLYFQDAALERYGYSMEQRFGPAGRFLTYPIDDPRQSKQRNQLIQPMFSAALFAFQIGMLPYNLIMDPPWEAEYDLGYYRPGDRVPTDVYYLPLTGVGPPLQGKNYGDGARGHNGANGPAAFPLPRW